MHPPSSAEIREFLFSLFLVFFILLGTHEIRRLDFGKIPPTRENIPVDNGCGPRPFLFGPRTFSLSHG